MSVFAKLIMVTDSDNHNKEYVMIKNSDNTFTAKYGRVGAKMMHRTYPMSQWNSKYEEKIEKGYKDMTEFYTVSSTKKTETDFKEIEDLKVRNLVSYLLKKAVLFVKREYNYEISETSMTRIEAVQERLDMLSNKEYEVWEFNKILKDIFAIIPRKMAKVDAYLAEGKNDYLNIVEREQKILDAMAGQVALKTKKQENIGKNCTILENADIEIRPCTPEEEAQIKKHLTKESEHLFKQAFYVKNKRTEKQFYEYCQKEHIKSNDIHFFYHGSLAENFWSILTKGLTVNPKAKIAGKMFGTGSYFATRARKSLRYTDIGNIHKSDSNTGFLAVYKVAYKKPWNIHEWKSECSQLNFEKVSQNGYDAVFAHAGKSLLNDEVIVYRDCQSTIRYLIEMSED